LVTVNNFSDGLVSPVLGYAVSCLGAFLGLRCVTRAHCYQGLARARWLAVAATAIGATGIWAMHFIAMLGFAIPGQEISYNVPITIASMLIVIGVVGVGLLVVGFGDGGSRRLLAGGLIVGIGVAVMHYLGMAAVVMPDSMSYSAPLLIASVAIAIIAGTAALWIGTWVRGVGATIGASLVMGVAVSGMHYTGMAAMRVHAGGMPGMSGASGDSFLLPLLLGIAFLTFVLLLAISLSPTEAEIRADAEFHHRLETLRAQAVPAVPAGEARPAYGDPAGRYEDSVEDRARVFEAPRFPDRRARLRRTVRTGTAGHAVPAGYAGTGGYAVRPAAQHAAGTGPQYAATPGGAPLVGGGGGDFEPGRELRRRLAYARARRDQQGPPLAPASAASRSAPGAGG
jgi:NO-binding membrane sensor protein with MHYT domain